MPYSTRDRSLVPDSRSRMAILWSFARPHRGKLTFALALGAATVAMELASPLATQRVLDALGVGQQFVAPLVLLICLLILGAAVTCWQAIVLGTIAEDVVFETRRGMVQRYLRARLLPLVQRPAGELVTRVTSDSVLLREAVSTSIVGLVNGSILLVGTVVMMFILDLTLALATLVAIALVAVVFAVLMPSIADSQDRAQDSLGRLGGSLSTTLRAIKTVKATTAERSQETLLVSHAANSRRHGLRAVRLEAAVWSVGWSGIQAATIFVLCFGAMRVASGELQLSTLIAFLLYVMGLLGPVTELGQNLTSLQAGVAAAGRIREVQSLPVESDSVTAPGGWRSDAAPAVALDDVHVRYHPDGPAVLQGVSLSIPPKGHTAIVGPSGAGKTTVFSLILRFIDAEKGRISLQGAPYEALSKTEVRQTIGYVEQDVPTLPGTLRENLTFGSTSPSAADITDVLREVRLEEFVSALPDGLDSALNSETVSGGQRQRIGIARAMLSKPKVLLLDEATAQVDGISEAAIGRMIDRQAKNGAVVTIAHRLSTVVGADRIFLMDAGRVVGAGTHQELLESSDLY
ncbi:MAG: ABC transporter ATP-binding protein, partial [Arthrobacter sp.]|nr:ABC transporter ATP-binding protein [Arthrobacter sp.]